jgi:hypothetical protein
MESGRSPLSFFKDLGESFKTNILKKNSPAYKAKERAQLLEKFQTAWENIKLDYITESNWTKHVNQTDIARCLQTMGDVLLREQAITDGGVDAGGCTEMFLNDDIMAQLVKISENDLPIGFRGEVIRFLANLITVLDSKILIQNAIHRPTLSLIKMALLDKEQKYENDLLILENDIATIIRDNPHLLYIFFSRAHAPRNVSKESIAAGQAFTSPVASPKMIRTSSSAGKDQLANLQQHDTEFESIMPEYEFPLFDHLLRYVHLEGQKGDFARQACLNLLELATSDLARYISKSEFASIAIAGLGGLHSQLPLRIPSGIAWGESFKSNSSGNAVVPESGGRSRAGNSRVTSAIDAFRNDMQSFVRFLSFIQGVILRCPNQIITSAMLADLKGTFLDNIVQCSITSASDFDGTTVASLFYLQQMLEVIKEDQLSAILCLFLLNGDEDDEDEEEDVGDGKDGKKGVEQTIISPAGSKASMESELRLHVRDILISKLNSLSEEVVTATLYLLQSLLTHHSHHALPLLIERLPLPKPYFNGSMVVVASTFDGSNGTPITSPTSATNPKSPMSPMSPNNSSGSASSKNKRKISPNAQAALKESVSLDIHDHLGMVSRYFALVPAQDTLPSTSLSSSSSSSTLPPAIANIGLPQPQNPPTTSTLSTIDPTNSTLSSSSLRNPSTTPEPSSNPNVPTISSTHLPVTPSPEEATLGAYLLEAEKVMRTHSTPQPRARALPPSHYGLASPYPSSKTPGPAANNSSFTQANEGHSSLYGSSSVRTTRIGMTEGFEGGLLDAHSVVREVMVDLGKDATLRKLLTKLANFFSHSYEINLVRTRSFFLIDFVFRLLLLKDFKRIIGKIVHQLTTKRAFIL